MIKQETKQQNKWTKYVYSKGITLIALIITIIILLILAGVTINFVLGENGILKSVGIAVDKYKEEEQKEKNVLDETYEYMNGEIRLKANTPETTAGTLVIVPNNWYIETTSIYSLAEQKNIKEGKRIANVYAVSDGQNNTIPIPKGFYYVGGNLSTGVVISDNQQDKDKYKNAEGGIAPSGISIIEENGVKKIKDELVGNQFVWIPCTEENYKKETKWEQGNTSYNTCYWSLGTSSFELNQIKKYGGYYVGRYEASLPQGTEEFTQPLDSNSDQYNFSGIPESKAGRIPWNFIDWNNAQSSARKMYENKETVESGLITGTRI